MNLKKEVIRLSRIFVGNFAKKIQEDIENKSDLSYLDETNVNIHDLLL